MHCPSLWLEPLPLPGGHSLPGRVLPGPMEGITAGAFCSYDGVDGVWFDLFGSAADLKAAYASDVKSFDAKPNTATVTCAKGNGNVDSTWTWTGQTGNHPDQSLLCVKDSNGQAWIEQADPTTNVMFTVLLKNGDQAALDKWWLKNDTLVEPGG